MKNLARALRRNMTDAERVLWRFLRDRQLNGYKFRRQHPIGPYIVDFVCLDKKLIVEVDGSQHAVRIDEDAKRSTYFEGRGFKILRFWNNEVLKERESVLSAIVSWLAENNPPSPRPSPPETGGEGE
jgi:adenine-specific DNA-methyltransferase